VKVVNNITNTGKITNSLIETKCKNDIFCLIETKSQ
jgi:hypothetical protein